MCHFGHNIDSIARVCQNWENKKDGGCAKTRAIVSRPSIWNPKVWSPYRNEIRWHPRLVFLPASRSTLSSQNLVSIFGKCTSQCLSVRIPYVPRRDSRQIFNFWPLAVDPPTAPSTDSPHADARPETNPISCGAVGADVSHLTWRPQSKHFWCHHQAIITQKKQQHAVARNLTTTTTSALDWVHTFR